MLNEKLRRYIIVIQRGCSSEPSFVGRVRPELTEEVARRIEERCRELRVIRRIIYKCIGEEGEISFTVKTGKLMMKVKDEKDLTRLLSKLIL